MTYSQDASALDMVIPLAAAPRDNATATPMQEIKGKYEDQF